MSQRKESPLIKLLIGGGVTVAFEAFAGGHYLEFCKIAKQCAPKGTTYTQITRQMIQHKGLTGILDGFLPWGAMQSVVKGASFGYGQAAAMRLLNTTDMNPRSKSILSGGIGGLVQGIVMNPMLLLKTRVMTDARFRGAVEGTVVLNGGGTAAIAKPGTLSTLVQTTRLSGALGLELMKTEGLMALTKGISVFSFKRFCDWTTRYAFVVAVEQLVKTHPDEKLSFGWQSFCSLSGGLLSAFATLPIDVTVARIQDARKAGSKVSIMEMYRHELKSGNALQFATRGFVPRAAHVALTTLMMKTVTSSVYDALMTRE